MAGTLPGIPSSWPLIAEMVMRSFALAACIQASMKRAIHSRFKRGREHAQDRRIVQVGVSEHRTKVKYPGNKISTTKYKWYSFLPKGLYEQFRRVANLYFAFHAAISLTPVSPVNPVTTVLPLVFVIGVALVKEAVEDFRRGREDKKVNNRLVSVLWSDGQFRKLRWKDVNVGDIVRVDCDNFFPADMLFLSSNDSSGTSYVETMNLDGETSLKIRICLDQTRELSHTAFKTFNAVVECEQPNPSIYTFVGNLIWMEKVSHLGPTQILLRGSKLRNTPYVYGVVLFTGFETKIMMNSLDPPSKRSSVERQLDFIILFQLALLVGMSVLSGLLFAIWLSMDFHKQWYLQPGRNSGNNSITFAQFNYKRPFFAGILQFFTGLVLYGYFVPISLYVSLEIVKIIQALFINYDIQLFHEETAKPASARTSNLNEELGQVSIILSDKTGTLTRNEMEFFKCSVAGISYGTGVTEIEKAVADQTGNELMPNHHDQICSNLKVEKGFNLKDSRLVDLNWQNEPRSDIIERFLEILALCHTVVTEGEPNPDTIKYLAESPDEAALVAAAKRLGFFMYKRSETSIHVKLYGKDGDATELKYELLNTLEFNSVRKRMSVIVRDPDGCLLLLCKGADNVIFERLSPEGKGFEPLTAQHMNEFAEAGLRTLAMGYRELNEQYYANWQKRWLAAKQEIMIAESQAEKLDELCEEIESDLILVGATAIEDKLQVGVPQTISKLLKAGIKIWVLTGDKMETAINIGYACSLLRHNTIKYIIRLEENRSIMSEMTNRGKSYDESCAEFVSRQIQEGNGALEAVQMEQETSHAIIIDGLSLNFVLNSDLLKQGFLALALKCDSVICCRASPIQKATVTELVRCHGKLICLAIGDGANDVGMIQKANIGVGIAGVEGQQAVMSSDIAIAQFRFLERLLLVHGAWCYNRVTFMIKYFFYKNFVFGFSVFFFNAYTRFSGQSIYADWYLSLYNVIFTAGPVVVIAILDQDVNATSLLKFPLLYKKGQVNASFTPSRIAIGMISGVTQAAACFFLVITAYKYSDRATGQTVGLYAIGTTMYTCIVFVVNIQIAFIVQYWTWIHHIFIWGEIIAWIAFLLISGELPTRFAGQLKMLFVGVVASAPSFYAITLVSTILALLPSFTICAFARNFRPDDYQIVQELEKLEVGTELHSGSTTQNFDSKHQQELELITSRSEDLEQESNVSTGTVFTSESRNWQELLDSQVQRLWSSNSEINQCVCVSSSS
eukprot:c24389_g1_i3 orf=295-4026(-)